MARSVIATHHFAQFLMDTLRSEQLLLLALVIGGAIFIVLWTTWWATSTPLSVIVPLCYVSLIVFALNLIVRLVYRQHNSETMFCAWVLVTFWLLLMSLLLWRRYRFLAIVSAVASSLVIVVATRMLVYGPSISKVRWSADNIHVMQHVMISVLLATLPIMSFFIEHFLSGRDVSTSEMDDWGEPVGGDNTHQT